MDSRQTILQSARSFLAGTALSRISGFARDVAMAVSFGSSPEIAAFMVSYRLANLFRRLLGEGGLQSGFVPCFTQMKESQGLFFRDAYASMGLISLLVIGFFELLGFFTLPYLEPSWRPVVELSMWMLPGLFFISLFGLNSAVLQCQKKYFLPAFAPVAFNLIWIASILIRPDVKFLSLAVTAAFMGQWLMTSLDAFRLLTLKEWLKPHLFSPLFRKLIKPLLLGLLGTGAMQLNSALDAIFARIADPAGPAYLWYAIRLQQVPLALFGIALAGALLPPLSRTEDVATRKAFLSHAIYVSGTVMSIATCAFFCLGSSGVNLLFGHGGFTAIAVQETTHALWGYGLGLIPAVFILLLSAYCYAEKNFITPVRASLASVVLSTSLNILFVFVFHLGALSIALATSLGALLNMLWLAKGRFPTDLILPLVKTFFLSCISASTVYLLAWQLTPTHDLMGQLLHFSSLTLCYFGILLLLRPLRVWKEGLI